MDMLIEVHVVSASRSLELHGPFSQPPIFFMATDRLACSSRPEHLRNSAHFHLVLLSLECAQLPC